MCCPARVAWQQRQSGSSKHLGLGTCPGCLPGPDSLPPVPVPVVPIPRELGPQEGSEVPELLRWLLSGPLLLGAPFPLSSASAWSCPTEAPSLLETLGSDPSPPLCAACIDRTATACSSRCAYNLSEADRTTRLS